MRGPKVKSALWGVLNLVGAIGLIALASTRVQAEQAGVTDPRLADRASAAFASHCFSPFMTAARAGETLAATGARVDFYDLDPLSGGAQSPVMGRAATLGTDRRCEVAFDGDYARLAESAALAGLRIEGIDDAAPLPDRYARTDATQLLAARQLNPRRIAVVHVGTRPGPNGVETFMLVERMTPLEALQ